MSCLGGMEIAIFLPLVFAATLLELGVSCYQAKKRGAKLEKLMMTTLNQENHEVDALVRTESGRQIGFQAQKDGTYKIITDFEGLTPTQLKKDEDLIHQIKQRYAYNVIKGELKKQGYNIVEEKNLEDKTIKITARRWA